MTAAALVEPTTVRWPGPVLPAAPAFTVRIPAGWRAVPVPGLLALVEPEIQRPDAFTANLTIASDGVSPGTTAEELLRVTVAALLPGWPGARLGPRPEPTRCCLAHTGETRAPSSTASARIHSLAAGVSTEHVLTVVVADTAPTVWHAYSLTSTWVPTVDGPGPADVDPGLVLGDLHASFSLQR